MLTFKTTVTEEEVKTAVKKYVMDKLEDKFCAHVDELEITSIKKNKKNFIVEGRQKPEPPKPKKGKAKKVKGKFKKSEATYLCGECEETYEECDCAGGPTCEGCDFSAADCICA